MARIPDAFIDDRAAAHRGHDDVERAAARVDTWSSDRSNAPVGKGC